MVIHHASTTHQRDETCLELRTKEAWEDLPQCGGRLAAHGWLRWSNVAELRAASPQDKFHVNLCGVSFIDAAGKVLLEKCTGRAGGW